MARKDKGKPPGKKAAKRHRKASTPVIAKPPVAAKPAAPAPTPPAPAQPVARVAAAKTPKPKPAHYFDDPLRVKRAIQALFAVCGITFLLDIVVHRHIDHPWEGIFGFYAVYGFVACVLLVLIAKEMRKFLMRKESYYDE